MSLIKNVKTACRKSGTNVSNLEAALNFPRGSVYKWDEHVPAISKVKLAADLLGVSVDSLLDGVKYEPKETPV